MFQEICNEILPEITITIRSSLAGSPNSSMVSHQLPVSEWEFSNGSLQDLRKNSIFGLGFKYETHFHKQCTLMKHKTENLKIELYLNIRGHLISSFNHRVPSLLLDI